MPHMDSLRSLVEHFVHDASSCTKSLSRVIGDRIKNAWLFCVLAHASCLRCMRHKRGAESTPRKILDADRAFAIKLPVKFYAIAWAVPGRAFVGAWDAQQ